MIDGPADPSAVSAIPSDAPGVPAVVLVVDDDESGRYATARVLRRAGFRVETAATGMEALRRAREGPDLVVLDVGLPDIDGFELCGRLKGLPETTHTPVLYLSARFPDVEDRIRGLDAGADAYLSQPVDPRELVALVRAMLRSWWARRALAVANRELDEFATAVSHDLKAPLRAIGSYARYLREDLEGTLEGESRLYLERLQNRVERMQALVDGTLEYARAGRERASREAMRVEPLVRGVLEVLDVPEGARLEVRGAVGAVVAERAPLEQVLRNLVGNALKHAGRPDPRVRVTVEEAEGAYHFTVEDDGPGIPPGMEERIWRLFHGAGGADGVEGTGIGLAIVRKLVEGHGGRAWVESEPGAGARFHFLWPRPAVAWPPPQPPSRNG